MIWLIFAHFIGDWGLQSEWLALNKGKHWLVMLAHCMIWTGCVCIALEYWNVFAYWKVVFLFLTHFVIDTWKCRVYAEKPFCQQPDACHLYIDQVLHFIQLIVVCSFD